MDNKPDLNSRVFFWLKINKMKTYTNKTDKVDERKCLYSEIRGNDKARKKAVRFSIKNEIENEKKEYT